jgi:hypothetical protein
MSAPEGISFLGIGFTGVGYLCLEIGVKKKLGSLDAWALEGGGVWKQGSSSGILEADVMRRSLHAPIAPGRTAGAYVCLLAVLLLWAPMWASAWMARGTACCMGTMCALHGHGNTRSPGKSEAPKNDRECQHPRGTGMVGCDMSCYHKEGASLVSSSVYVLPESVDISAPSETVNSTVASKPEAVLQVFAPPSPPPKGSLL